MENIANILGPLLWDQIESTYLEYVQRDRFSGVDLEIAPRGQLIRSVRDLVNRASSWNHLKDGLHVGTQRVQVSMQMTLGTFGDLALVSKPRGRLLMKDVMVHALCRLQIPSLLSRASSHAVSAAGEAAYAALLADAKCASWDDVVRLVGQHEDALTRALAPILIDQRKDKLLQDFYRSPVSETGFTRWHPRAYSSYGRPLKSKVISCEGGGQIQMHVSRYTDDTGSDIRPYEWAAEFRPSSQDENDLPEAAVCGMVYVLPREDEHVLCSPSDLRWAADAVADVDVAQVMAFLRQQVDAMDLMDQGDLCFVWLWERKVGASKGLGAGLLIPALQDLKRRFRALKTVVICLEPYQFLTPYLANDPPEVQVSRHEASERLEHYARAISPEKTINGALRFITTRPMSFGETLVALGEADLDDGERV